MQSVFSTLPSWVILVRLMMILPTGSLRHLFSSHLVLPGSLLTTCSDLLSITSLPPKVNGLKMLANELKKISLRRLIFCFEILCVPQTLDTSVL